MYFNMYFNMPKVVNSQPHMHMHIGQTMNMYPYSTAANLAVVHEFDKV